MTSHIHPRSSNVSRVRLPANQVQTSAPERPGNKEGWWGSTQISLRREDRRDSLSEPRVGGAGEESDQVVGAGERRRRVLKETTRKGGIWG